MHLRRLVLRGGLQVGFGLVGQHAILFLRHFVVARFLPPDQFGIGLTFMSVAGALEILSDMGIELYLMRADKRCLTEVQRTLHALQVLRAFVSAATLYLLSDVISRFLNVPEASWAYQLLALLMFIRGFFHLDVRRYERDLIYIPGVITNLGSICAGAITAMLLAALTSAYSAIIFGYCVQFLSSVLFSHLFAKNRYWFSVNKALMVDIIKFGSPLLINNSILYVMRQGDKIAVASLLGVVELAHYGVASLLSNAILVIMLRLTGQIYIPMLLQHPPRTEQFESVYFKCGLMSIISSIFILINFGLSGHDMVTIIFGNSYDVSNLLIVLLAVQISFAIFRNSQQALLMSVGNSTLTLYANLVSVGGALVAFVLLWLGANLETAVAAISIAEIFAALFAILLANKFVPIARRPTMAYFILLVVCAILFVISTPVTESLTNSHRLIISLALNSGLLAICLASSEIRNLIWSLREKK